MSSALTAVGISNVLVAVIVILLSLPLLKRRVPMNHWYGARFKKSFESENNWYQINAYSARLFILWSIPLLITGIATFFLPVEGNEGVTVILASAPLLLCIPALITYRFAKKFI
jgi:hypothetical protein